MEPCKVDDRSPATITIGINRKEMRVIAQSSECGVVFKEVDLVFKEITMGEENRKEKRKESKKRKLEAYMRAVQSNDIADSDRKKLKCGIEENNTEISQHVYPCENVQIPVQHPYSKEEFQAIRARKNERQKARMQLPIFFIAGFGHDAEVSLDELNSITSPKATLNIQDIQHLMSFSILGRKSPYRTRWCKLMRYDKLSHVVVVVIDGLSIHALHQYKNKFNNIFSIFSSGVKVSPQCKYGNLMSELCQAPLSVSSREKLIHELDSVNTAIKPGDINESLKMLFQIMSDNSEAEEITENREDNFNRTKLLLDVKNIVLENYPFEHKLHAIKLDGYKYTKEKYKPVTANSPTFAVDCEMCVTAANQSELTRISVVNEELQVVYESLVKPYSVITDYLTRYSGIYEDTLNGVTTTLEDVQNKIQEILPADAILCGHSLNYDLHAMRMIHPYVIDTSIIYNLSGIPAKKPSLKSISQVFLGEVIQNSPDGHHPIEDSLSTMKLVKLKLRESFEFGNVLLNFQTPDPPIDQQSESDGCKYIVNKTCFAPNKSFFKHAKKQAKKVLLIGTSELVKQIPVIENMDDTYYVNAKDNKDVIAKGRALSRENDMTICHMDMKKPNHHISDGAAERLDRRIAKLYKSCAAKSLFMVLFSGLVIDDTDTQNGFCLARIKE